MKLLVKPSSWESYLCRFCRVRRAHHWMKLPTLMVHTTAPYQQLNFSHDWISYLHREPLCDKRYNLQAYLWLQLQHM